MKKKKEKFGIVKSIFVFVLLGFIVGVMWFCVVMGFELAQLLFNWIGGWFL